MHGRGALQRRALRFMPMMRINAAKSAAWWRAFHLEESADLQRGGGRGGAGGAAVAGALQRGVGEH
jgi:hypothetical protein